MNTEIQTQPMDESEKHLNLVMRFFTAPVEVRTYTNLFYLALAFPLGLFYFIFLLTGLALGFGLTIIWIGLPILAVVLAASWGMAALVAAYVFYDNARHRMDAFFGGGTAFDHVDLAQRR